MDSIGYMTIASLGASEEYDTQIIKEVWSGSKYSNLSAMEAQANCETVYEKQGVDAYNKCYAAGVSCGTDAVCNEVAKRYSEALAKGYTKDFESFKRKSNTLAQVGEIGGALLQGVLTKLGFGKKDTPPPPATQPQPDTPRKDNTMLYVGVGAAILIAAGFGIYYATKKK